MSRAPAITFTWFVLTKDPSGQKQDAFRQLFLSHKVAGTVQDEDTLAAFFASLAAKGHIPSEEIQQGGKQYLRRFIAYRAKVAKDRAARQKPKSFYRLRNYRRSNHMGE